MTSSSRWLYLPLDVKVREIEGKTLLALRAAAHGYHVVIGQKQKFPSILSCYPRGHYVGFAALENLYNEYERFRKQGHGIILMDEEGLVTLDEKIYLRNRLSPNTLAIGEIFVAWGKAQVTFLQKYRPEHMKIATIAGNPRFDVLRPEYRNLYNDPVTKIKKEHGNFILINSNFGSCNHFSGGEVYRKSLRDKKIIRTEEEFSYYSRYFEYRSAIMQEFLKILPTLRDTFPDTRIIIRPHPSENSQIWKDHAEKLSNVHVIHEGSAIPWLLAAGAMIHNFCTTSVESFVLGLTPIAYRPMINEELETPLPSIASIEAKSQKDLLAAVKFVLSGQSDPDRPKKLKILSEYIANLEGAYASDVILDRLEALPLPSSPLDILAPVLHTARKTAEKIKSLGRAKNDYITHKFPGLDVSEIHDLAKRMESWRGQYASLRTAKIHDNCILIRKT